MGWGRKLALIAGVSVIGASGGAVAQQGQKITGPIATYWISAATQTGFGMPGMGGAGGGRPSASAMMSAMMGGGGQAVKTLRLDLGSSQTAADPAADHLPPAGLGAGPDLPLVTPKAQPVQHVESDAPEPPREFQKPRGRMLIFWGCGEHAKPGQPVVIDFSKIDPRSPQMPPGFTALLKSISYTPQQGPAPGRDRTYGGWPNEKTRTQVPSNGSLVGEHTIQGNYSPTIKFTLDEDQDFLGPLNLTTNAKNAGGWVDLGWNLVGNAQAYFATAMGGGQDQVVLWTSSETQGAAFAAPEYLSPGDIGRLVAAKTLMGPATRACQVPKEAIDAMPQGILQLVAYGGEANFVYPPRPKDPKIPWNRQWAVKVRYRSATGGLLGMAMPQMSAGRQASSAPQPGQPQPPPTPPQRPSAADILRKGILGGALPFPH